MRVTSGRRATDGLAGWLYTGKHGGCVGGRSWFRSSDRPFIQGAVQDLAKVLVFVGTWTTVTTLSGMRDAEKMVKRCRLKGTAVRKRIELLTEVSSITKGK